jgi:hypothetical protein
MREEKYFLLSQYLCQIFPFLPSRFIDGRGELFSLLSLFGRLRRRRCQGKKGRQVFSSPPSLFSSSLWSAQIPRHNGKAFRPEISLRRVFPPRALSIAAAAAVGAGAAAVFCLVQKGGKCGESFIIFNPFPIPQVETVRRTSERSCRQRRRRRWRLPPPSTCGNGNVGRPTSRNSVLAVAEWHPRAKETAAPAHRSSRAC